MRTSRCWLAIAVIAAGFVAVPTAAAVEADAIAQKGCFAQTYNDHFRVLSYHRGTRIAHLSRYGIAPSGSHKISRTAAFETKVTASAKLSAGASAGASSIFAHVEAHFDVTVRAAGQHTRSGSVTVTDTVKNPTSHNKLFIAFDGVNTYSGAYRYVFCGWDQQVHRHRGHYLTYNDYTQAILRCGAGDAGVRLFKRALNHCS